MKKANLFLLLPLFVSLSSCTEKKENVTLTFIQHTFRDFAYDENNEIYGYYFKNDEIAKTTFVYDYGYYLTQEDMKGFDNRSLNYRVPPLKYGFWSFTFFTTDLDE